MTDDLNNNDEQQADPADALADLADSNNGEIVVPDEQDEVETDPLAALDKMAQADEDASDPADFAAAAAAIVAEGVSDEVFSGTGAPLGASVGFHVTAGDRHRRHHAHLYKKTMIPFLLVVGVLLVLIGLIAAAMVFQATPEEKEYYNWYSRMRIVMFVSFPLAAAVFVGAWWFHRDVNRKT